LQFHLAFKTSIFQDLSGSDIRKDQKRGNGSSRFEFFEQNDVLKALALLENNNYYVYHREFINFKISIFVYFAKEIFIYANKK
jgi:hypothetical protein